MLTEPPPEDKKEQMEIDDAQGVRTTPYTPPAYPYDRLVPIQEIAARSFEQVIDLSVGTPIDPPATAVLRALTESADAARSYPPSVGTAALLDAFSEWFEKRLGVKISTSCIGATIGSKEFVAGLPMLLRLRQPQRDTVLYPEMSYPSYAMGAELAGCRAVAVPLDADFRLDLSAISPSDVDRALCLWVNSPGNPTGALDDLSAAADWGRAHQVLVVSDECYVEFTWGGANDCPGGRRGDTILRYGSKGVLAVHSLSKRSNLAGLRVGCYAGDAEVVNFLREVRKHQGLMVPGPAQAAGVVALADQASADAQAARYEQRLTTLAQAVANLGIDVRLPSGGFYLWCSLAGHDGWSLASLLASRLGVVASPGEFYGPAAMQYLRVAAVADDATCAEVLRRSTT